MSKTRRRDLFRFAAGGGLGLALAQKGGDAAATEHGEGHDHRPMSGPLSTAIVSFGQWPTNPPLDRHPNLAPLDRNGHLVVPNVVTIKAGGTVNYIIAGLHQIAVYDKGIRPEHINATLLVPPAAGGPPVLIDDPAGRLYRGLDPTVLPTLSIPPAPAPPPASQQMLTDRVEVVHFPRRGTYLVICTVVFHFLQDKMYGWVRVLP
jgi:hypothetical protein